VSKVAGQGSWDDYLRHAMALAHVQNAAELSRRSGISESQISRWLKNRGAPDVETLRKVARVLNRPLLEVVVAAGHLTPDEARMKDAPTIPEPASVRDTLLADPALSAAGRAMLLAAYDAATSDDQGAEMLRRAGLGERTVRARAREKSNSVSRPPEQDRRRGTGT
jgi:transcriptional regulator with XRE-family HTH domain